MNNSKCESCDYCDNCGNSKSCDFCDYCNYCDYCKNLKMTEYNYFCWSEVFEDKNSFQQKRYRIFNIEVSEQEYNKVKKIYNKLEFDEDEPYETRFQTAFKKMRDNLDDKGRQEYLDIPYFNAEGFKFITGIDVNLEAEEKVIM